MVGFCHLTDSHHYHHGQKPTMVGICHGGNMPVGRLGKYLVNQRLIVLPACIPLISLALSLTAPDAMKSVGIKQLCSHQD